MAKKRGKKFRIFNIQIHLTNRWLYTFIAIGILAIIGVGVWAATTYPSSGAGHLYTEISTCAANKILKMNSAGTAWTCGDDATGGISTNPLYVEGAITAPEGTLRDDGGGWVRTYGATGWYSQTYGGGWYMTDNTWIRSYGNRNIYHNTGIMRTDGTFQVGPDGNRFIVNTAGNVGIGTSSPGAKLDVAGRLRLSKESIWVNSITSLNGISIPSSPLFPCSASNRGEIVFFSYKDFTDFLCSCGLRRGEYYWNCPS